MNPFTKRKFLNLSLESQHKKCAELLRQLYEFPQSEILGYYNEIQRWMQESPLTAPCPETISNCYHRHMNQARIHLPEYSLLPYARQGDRATPIANKLDVHVYLHQIRSAHNVGSILRTMEAFHFGTVYLSADTPKREHTQVNKTAMGCADRLDYYDDVDVNHLPRPLIALETSVHAVPIDDFIFPYPCCIAIGNEEYGLSKEVLTKADVIVEIPLYGRKNSLNVANAFAIAAAAVSQQLRNKEI